MNISNPIVANAIQSHTARNMLTSKQYKSIESILDSAERDVTKTEDSSKAVARSLDDLHRTMTEMVRGGFDEEAQKDAIEIGKEVDACSKMLENFIGRLKLLRSAVDRMTRKYSTYDPKRLID